jgi:hypothetical protein
MNKRVIVLLYILACPSTIFAQYVLSIQKQVLHDVSMLDRCETLVAKQDTLIVSLQKNVSALEGTVSSCLILNTDYQTQISYLKQINFDSNKEIILLTKEKKRLKRANRWLKVLIPVVVGGTIWLDR